MREATIALIGDFNPGVLAHRAIEKCFGVSRESGTRGVEPVWIQTKDVLEAGERQFARFQGVWCVPASPYQNVEGALWAIHYARTRRIPFLGTCGGFQHALLEYARNVLKLEGAEHAETNPNSSLPLLSKMRCSLVEQSKTIKVDSEVFSRIYGAHSGVEEFHCS